MLLLFRTGIALNGERMTTADQPHAAFDSGAAPATRDIIDVDDALERILGDRSLYARMLARFRQDWHDVTAQVRTALASGHGEQAHSLAHTLHGAAGMIGATELHRQAGALEAAIRTGSPAMQSELDALEPALARVLQLLDTLLRSAPAETPGASVRPLIDDAALLAQLDDLLGSGDGAAIDLLEASSASLKAILGESGWQQVTLAANEFDFEGALDALRRASGPK
jgi:HPt (histidine-containing phosphotransfer) domain-containing protein